MSKRIVGPFNRVEGDLEVRIDHDGQQVTEARVVSPLYRGFEQMLQGKAPQDALVYVPRICGICSVAQSVAAASALAAAMGTTPPRNGQLATNLILATENLADHLSHFYLFFMPDFARDTYRSEAWYPAAADRFRALHGTAASTMLPRRAEFMHILGLMAGKWPHSLALQPGGVTRSLEPQERSRVTSILFALRRFLEQTLFGDTLEAIAALNSAAALDNWRAQQPPEQSDFRHFLHLADALDFRHLGRTGDRFMSFGAYHYGGGEGKQPLFGQGVWMADKTTGTLATLDQGAIREDVSHSWMQMQSEPRHPYDGITLPAEDLTAEESYSWCKSPRLDGQVVEVGALARQVVNGHPMIRDLAARDGGNVRNRVIARLLELALVVPAMEQWARELQIGEPYYQPAQLPDEAEGHGLVEAARGSLGHWLRIRKGRILNYQIIAPTTWNFSPRDNNETPGPLEQALVGAPLREDELGRDGADPVAVQHIVRSFDPCMVCTVH